MPIDAGYEPDPIIDDPEPAAHAGDAAHYWLSSTDRDYVAIVRRDAEVCARRSRKRQRLHFHRESEPCDDEVHQDIEPPVVRVERPARGATFYTIP